MKMTKKQLRNYIATNTNYKHIAESDKLWKYFTKSNYYKYINLQSLQEEYIEYYCEQFSDDIYHLNLT